ncbi:hypothetical protein BC829DRAFT_487650 [Chytridium lagenaria]|nr:hypothetical protein BC829DRAFT_487650 [Chytridium lagenaria]
MPFRRLARSSRGVMELYVHFPATLKSLYSIEIATILHSLSPYLTSWRPTGSGLCLVPLRQIVLTPVHSLPPTHPHPDPLVFTSTNEYFPSDFDDSYQNFIVPPSLSTDELHAVPEDLTLSYPSRLIIAWLVKESLGQQERLKGDGGVWQASLPSSHTSVITSESSMSPSPSVKMTRICAITLLISLIPFTFAQSDTTVIAGTDTAIATVAPSPVPTSIATTAASQQPRPNSRPDWSPWKPHKLDGCATGCLGNLLNVVNVALSSEKASEACLDASTPTTLANCRKNCPDDLNIFNTIQSYCSTVPKPAPLPTARAQTSNSINVAAGVITYVAGLQS